MRTLALVCIVACGPNSGSQSSTGEDNLKAISPKFADLDPAVLPADWNALSPYSFKLSQDYPTTLPEPQLYPWQTIDYTLDPDGYMMALRDYCFKGFIHPNAPQKDFRAEFNTEAKWFHVPWMHTGQRGREWMHGLTRERDADPYRLAPTQTKKVQDWGIGMYNDVGGYTIGQVWADANNPQPRKAQFREGAVVFKLLFSAADPDTEVPWIKSSVTWNAAVSSAISLYSKRAVREMRLVQMDIAVKDTRSPTGWVYGTLVFDEGAQTTDDLGAFGKMMPVGIAYGNAAEETVLAKAIPEVARATLGVGGRMNGPGDNPQSSCLSCHATAEWKATEDAVLSGMVAPNVEQQDKWFRNLADGEPFDEGQISLQTSLQLQISLANFYAAPKSKGLPVEAGRPADNNAENDPRDSDIIPTGATGPTAAP